MSSSIAHLADDLQTQFAAESAHWGGSTDQSESWHHAAQIRRIEDAINRMGWMADLISQKIGGDVCRGDAEEWLVHGSYRDAKERLDRSAPGIAS